MGAQSPAQIRQLLKGNREPMQKLKKKPKVFRPSVNKSNTNATKFRESFGSEGV